MPNRLINETSPYLLQHAHNPVDWYPWGPEALERACREDRPILLSVGYSACHWCHVMEHESFEDAEIARLMNEHFVSIKVDREERPDLDSIYMSAVQAISGHGGWPMTVFLTPQGVPFWGGTYFPPDDRGQMPGFRRVLLSMAQAYQTRRQDVTKSAAQMEQHLRERGPVARSDQALRTDILASAYRGAASQFDPAFGGFGHAPKFPQPMTLEFLLRYWRRTGEGDALAMVEQTLRRMAEGGIYDQLGGGFHRYSTDQEWLVPHFEKMLYDNALLSRSYLEAYQATHDDLYRRVAAETLDYVRREMTSPEGGFYSTQDADSEGVEGKFFVWTPQEVRQVLGPDASLFGAAYDVTERGNFEQGNILHVVRTVVELAGQFGLPAAEVAERLAAGRRSLFAAREARVHPGRDEKILTAWNGLMLHSFAAAASILGRTDYAGVAQRNARFLLETLRQNGRLLRTYKDGRARLNAYLEDYAYLAQGLLALYEADFDRRWLDEAVALARVMLEQFWDGERGGFYDTSADHEALVARPKEVLDNATPSGNAVATEVLLRLAVLTGDRSWEERAVETLRGLAPLIERYPTAFGRALCALDFHLGPVQEIAIVGDPGAAGTQDLLAVVHKRYMPNKVVALARPGDATAAAGLPLLAERALLGGRATAYVCQNYVCQLPVTAPEALAAQLAE